jgi:hypothetical protein
MSAGYFIDNHNSNELWTYHYSLKGITNAAMVSKATMVFKVIVVSQ